MNKAPELFPIVDPNQDWRFLANKFLNHYPDRRPTVFNHVIEKENYDLHS
jgi:hypothetical protein